MSTNNTYKHTNLIFSPGREKNKYEFQFKPSLKKINKMDSQIFTFTPRQNRRELKSVNRLNTDHSPEFFYDNYSPREQPKSPAKQIVVHSPKSITPRQKQLSNLISWDNHDSILHRFDELSKYKPKSNYKNASSFSDYQQINKSKELTQNIMKCNKELKLLEGSNPQPFTFKQSIENKSIHSLYKWKKNYYK